LRLIKRFGTLVSESIGAEQRCAFVPIARLYHNVDAREITRRPLEMACRRGDVAAHERGVASFDPQLRLLLQSHQGARLKLNRLGFLQKAVRRFEVTFSEGRISGLDELGYSAFGLGQSLQRVRISRNSSAFAIRNASSSSSVASGISRPNCRASFSSKREGRPDARSGVASRALFTRDVERHAERVDRLYMRVCNLACFDV
jgi:hypothetical protein